jgi:hypothetical protein
MGKKKRSYQRELRCGRWRWSRCRVVAPPPLRALHPVVGFVVLEVSLSDFYPEDERCVFFPSHLWRGKTGTDWKLKQAWCRKEKINRPGADEYILGLGLTLRFQLAHVRARP